MSEISSFTEAGEQGSPEWLAARVGNVTCSRFKDVLAVLKNGKPSEKRNTYLWEVVIERLTGKSAEHYTSVAMDWGTNTEPLARMRYEAVTGAMVAEVGFIHHPSIKLCGGSPDGCIDDDGAIEIKCPFNSANHLQTIMGGMPEEHLPQVQGVMAVTGRKWLDFISFDPRLPPEYQMYVQRIPRDDRYISAMETQIIAFLAEVETTLISLAEAK